MSSIRTKIIILSSMLVPLILIFLPVLGPGRMIFGTDFLTGGYPTRYFEYNEPYLWLWQPFVFGGVPGIGAVTFGDAFYPVSIVLRALHTLPHQIQVYLYLIHLFLAGIFTYLFVFDLFKRREAAMIAAVSYMFTGSIFSLVYGGHEGRMIVNCLLPMVFFLLNRGLDRRKFYWFALAGAAYGASILSPHVQMAYYLGMMTFVFAVVKVYSTRKKGVVRPVVGYILFAVVAALIAAPLALPLLKYIPFSPRGGAGRGYGFATSWAMPPEETLNLITPHFSGLLDNYWGRNFFKLHTEYIGILPLILAFIGIFYAWKRKETKFLTGWAIFALIFSFGGYTPIYRIFYHLLPGVSKFRAPAQIFYTLAFAISILAAIGVEQLLKGIKDDRRLRYILYTFGGITFLLLLLALMKNPIIGIGQGLSPEKLKILTRNVPDLQSGSFLALIFVAVSGALITFLHKKKITPMAFGIAASILIFLDLWIVDHRFLKTVDPPKRYYAADEIVRFLKGDNDHFRVFPVGSGTRLAYHPGNYLLVHDIENCGGEHGNQLKRYQDFIGAENTVMFRPGNLYNQNMLSVLNVKYAILMNFDKKQLPPEQPSENYLLKTIRTIIDTTRFRKAYQGYRYSVYQNLAVVPRAVIYYDYEVLPEEVITSRIQSPGFDPKREVILEEDIGIKKTAEPYTPVKIISYQPNRIELSYRSDQDGILYLADNYYPMWHAAVDNQKTRIYRANYTFRAIRAPKGEHRVSFWFDSPYINLGIILMIVGIILTIGLVMLTNLGIIRL